MYTYSGCFPAFRFHAFQKQRCQREALEHKIKLLQAEGASDTDAAHLQAQLAELQVKLVDELKVVAAACQCVNI